MGRAELRGIYVELSTSQVRYATAVGRMRNRIDTNAPTIREGKILNDGEMISVCGAIGEAMYAEAFDVPWNYTVQSEEEFHARRGEPDFPPDVQVRTTLRPLGGLWVKRGEKLRHRFVLIAPVRWPTIGRVVGWAWGREAKKPKHWQGDAPRPNWMMRQDELRQMSTFDVQR